jgi:hypothetical protein
MRKHVTPFTGTWKLNVAQSQFGSAPPPQSETITWAPDGTGTVEGIDAQGKPFHWSIPWSGGKEVPLDGIENGVSISTIRGPVLDAQTKMAGKTVTTVHAVVSPDGRTLTVTLDAIDEQGRPTQGVAIYERQ